MAESMGLRKPKWKPGNTHKFFIDVPFRRNAGTGVPAPERRRELLDRLGVWPIRAQVDPAPHKTLRRLMAKDFTGELFIRG
jgi:hypothetical protein